MREIKTYAVRGLLEWKALIPAGGASLTLVFKGGFMGASGIQPAKLTTDNPAIQRIIEGSTHFRSGKIFQYGATVKAEDPTPNHRQVISNGEKSVTKEETSNDESESRRPGQEDTDQPGRRPDDVNGC